MISNLFFIFSEIEIRQILQYRDSIGIIQTIYELAYLDGLKTGKLKQLPHSSAHKAELIYTKSLLNIKSQFNAYFIMRFERLEKLGGYQSQSFAGDRNRIYARYNNRVTNRMSYGLTV